MRKYWYYTFVSKNIMGQDICSTESGAFDLYETTKALGDSYGRSCIITYWHEISVNQYEKMKEYFEKSNK